MRLPKTWQLSATLNVTNDEQCMNKGAGQTNGWLWTTVSPERFSCLQSTNQRFLRARLQPGIDFCIFLFMCSLFIYTIFLYNLFKRDGNYFKAVVNLLMSCYADRLVLCWSVESWPSLSSRPGVLLKENS